MADHGSYGLGVVLRLCRFFRFCRFLRLSFRFRFRLGFLIRCLRLRRRFLLVSGIRCLNLTVGRRGIFLLSLLVVLAVGYILIRCGSIFFIYIVLCRIAGSLVIRGSRIFIVLIGVIGIRIFFLCVGRSCLVSILLGLIGDDVYFLISKCRLVTADCDAFGLLHFLNAVNCTCDVGGATDRLVPVVDIQEQNLLVAGHHVHVVSVFREANKNS